MKKQVAKNTSSSPPSTVSAPKSSSTETPVRPTSARAAAPLAALRGGGGGGNNAAAAAAKKPAPAPALAVLSVFEDDSLSSSTAPESLSGSRTPSRSQTPRTPDHTVTMMIRDSNTSPSSVTSSPIRKRKTAGESSDEDASAAGNNSAPEDSHREVTINTGPSFSKTTARPTNGRQNSIMRASSDLTRSTSGILAVGQIDLNSSTSSTPVQRRKTQNDRYVPSPASPSATTEDMEYHIRSDTSDQLTQRYQQQQQQQQINESRGPGGTVSSSPVSPQPSAEENLVRMEPRDMPRSNAGILASCSSEGRLALLGGGGQVQLSQMADRQAAIDQLKSFAAMLQLIQSGGAGGAMSNNSNNSISPPMSAMAHSEPMHHIIHAAMSYQRRFESPLTDQDLYVIGDARCKLENDLKQIASEVLLYKQGKIRDLSQVPFEEIQGLSAYKDALLRYIFLPYQALQSDQASLPELGRACLLKANPGSGIRTLVKAMCQSYNINCIVVNTAINPQSKVTMLLAYAMLIQPCVVFFDHCENWFGEKSNEKRPREDQATLMEMQARLMQLKPLTHPSSRVWLVFSMLPEQNPFEALGCILNGCIFDDSLQRLSEEQNFSLLMTMWKNSILKLLDDNRKGPVDSFTPGEIDLIIREQLNTGALSHLARVQKNNNYSPGALWIIVKRCFDEMRMEFVLSAHHKRTGNGANSVIMSNMSALDSIRSQIPTVDIVKKILGKIRYALNDSVNFM